MERVQHLLDSLCAGNDIKYQENGEVLLVTPIDVTKPTQYCFELFRALSVEDIECLTKGYRNSFPKPLKEFYQLSNGAFLFGRFISIYGVPKWDARYKQPVALAFADGHRTKGCPNHRLFFASYNTEPQIQVFFDTREKDNMHVYAARYGNNEIIAEWPSFEEWLITESNRYSQKYKNGEYHIENIVEGVLSDIVFEF